jgi:hypothetical protein
MVEVMIVSLRKGQRNSRGARARGDERQRRRSRVAIMARLKCPFVAFASRAAAQRRTNPTKRAATAALSEL